MVLAASLNNHRVVSARVNLPAWGTWYAEATLDTEQTLTGAVQLKIADATYLGTILNGGPDKGKSAYRIVGGKGGWGRTLPKKSYANDAGVKLSTVLSDAAQSVGETLDLGARSSDRVGPAFVRPDEPACRLLEQLAPSAWYIGEDGITHLGKRSTSMLDAKVPRVSPIDRARGTVTLAAESIVNIKPGVMVDGLEAVDVVHEISAEGGLRSTVWGKRSTGGTSRQMAAFRAVIDQLEAARRFYGVWKYRVVTQEGSRVNLQPVRVSSGMPDLTRVPVRPGVSGAKSTLTPGCTVLVAFADADPGQPFVFAQEEADGEGFKPILTEIDATTVLKLGAGVKPAAAAGDFAGPFPIIPTQVKVLI